MTLLTLDYKIEYIFISGTYVHRTIKTKLYKVRNALLAPPQKKRQKGYLYKRGYLLLKILFSIMEFKVYYLHILKIH